MKKLLIILMIVVVAIFLYQKSRHKNGNGNILIGGEKDQNQISTVILPHHDLVAEERNKFMAQLPEKTSPKSIILISTNHFDKGSKNIITTKKEWKLDSGPVEADNQIVDKLLENESVADEESSFSDEHGITNILDGVKNNFPNAKIVPIIIKSNTTQEKIAEITDKLNFICGNDCLLIASVDFSHYQPGALAEIHDSTSIRALSNLDKDLVTKSETDSPECLYFALDWAGKKGTEKFNLWQNNNSGKISSNRDAESTSYVFGYYEKGDKQIQDKEFSFIIGGDMMFDRNIEYHFQGDKLQNVMSEMGNRVFWGTDLSLANLEGPISKDRLPYDNTKGSMVFNFQPETTSVLQWLGINAVSLANNHTLNNGQKGLANTKDILKEADIDYIGQDGKFNEESVKQFTYGKVKVSVLTIDTLNTDTDLVPVIKAQKEKSDFIIVMPHWGVEYEPIHHPSQKSLAKKWIDAGADLIVGSHPHVMQDAEIYNGRTIFYSLGNLLFDQDFSAETQRGLIIAGNYNIDSKKLNLVILPTLSKNYKPALMIGAEKTTTLTEYRANLNTPSTETGYGYDKIELQY